MDHQEKMELVREANTHNGLGMPYDGKYVNKLKDMVRGGISATQLRKEIGRTQRQMGRERNPEKHQEIKKVKKLGPLAAIFLFRNWKRKEKRG